MAGVGGKEADLQGHGFFSRTKDRLLVANTQLLALSPCAGPSWLRPSLPPLRAQGAAWRRRG